MILREEVSVMEAGITGFAAMRSASTPAATPKVSISSSLMIHVMKPLAYSFRTSLVFELYFLFYKLGKPI